MNAGLDFIKQQHRFHSGRLKIEWLLLTLVFIGLFARCYWLMVVEHDFWWGHRQQRFISEKRPILKRHTIVDRNNAVIAQSIPTVVVGWHPSQNFAPLTPKQEQRLSSIAGQPWPEWLQQHQGEKKFIYLTRNTALDLQQQAELKKIPGIEIFPSSKRHYPMGACGAQTIGYLNFEQQGAEGIERAFETQLTPKEDPAALSPKILRDVKQRWFFWEKSETQAQSEPPVLALTLDNRVTAILYHHLKKAYEEGNVASFSAVVIDPTNGELLGSVSYPSFNPNEPGGYDSNWRFKPLLDLYEVGSVMKPFTLAALLSQHPEAISFQTRTDPGELIIQKHAITDVTKRRSFTFPEILIHSSNIALIKALRAYPIKPSLVQGLKDCGHGQLTGLPFENEPAPYLPRKVKAKSLDEASLSFGYNSQMSLLQLARSYLLFANPHSPVPPLKITLGEQTPMSASSFDPKISVQAREEIAGILQKVVQEGSARRAFLKNIPIAGKTGTAKRVGEHGYEERYHAFFVGYFPAENPRYLLAIHADDPQGKIYGGEVCAPLVKRIAPQLMALPVLQAEAPR